MKPENIKVFDIFQMERRLVVPLFQRPYVWRQEKQWEPLWEDIKEKTDEVLQYNGDSQHPIRRHFLGAAVISQIKTFGRQIAAMEIIDGQQRLTTLQIILCALRDFSKSEGYDRSARTLDRVTENSCDLDDEQERYKVWPTSSDRSVYEAIFEAGSPDALEDKFPLQIARYARKPTPRHLLVDAYLYYYDVISSYCHNEDADQDPDADEEEDAQTLKTRLDALRSAITNYMEVVVIELEEGDDPQIIFETLNALGEPLLPSDLLRNFVFLEASRKRENVDRLYQQYWREFDGDNGQDYFWKKDQKQGRTLRPLLDLFIFHYLTCQAKREIPIKHLYQEFRAWWLRNCPSVEAGLQQLQAASRHYRQFFEPAGPSNHSRLSVFCHRLAVLDVGTVYPLLLFLTISSGSLRPGELEGMLSDIESYLVRRMVCGLTPKNYNKTFLSLLQRLSGSADVSRATLRQFLLEADGPSVRWPTDTDFYDAWLEKPAYQELGAAKTSMILEAIDLQIVTRRQEQMHLASQVTVEHVLPQSFRENDWPAGDVSEAGIEALGRLLHTFGNLTLLTQSLNSSISNGPFAQKRPQIALQSSLRLNAYFQRFANSDVWSEDTILERGEELFATALEIWPR